MKKQVEVHIPTEQPLLLFDGVCNLCNGYVNWLIDHDPKGHFRYASLQSEVGQSVLQQLGMSEKELSTVLLIQKGSVYSHSDVALEITRQLGGLWPLLYVLKVIPRFIRDTIYNWVAKNRYKWFGELDSCRMPTPELKARFLG